MLYWFRRQKVPIAIVLINTRAGVSRGVLYLPTHGGGCAEYRPLRVDQNSAPASSSVHRVALLTLVTYSCSYAARLLVDGRRPEHTHRGANNFAT